MSDLKEKLEKEIGQKLPESFAELVAELEPANTTGENFDLLKNLAVVGAGLGSLFTGNFDFGLLSGLTGFFGVKLDSTLTKMKSVLGIKDWALDRTVVERYEKIKQMDVLLSYYAAFKALEKLEPEIKKLKANLKKPEELAKLCRKQPLNYIEYKGIRKRSLLHCSIGRWGSREHNDCGPEVSPVSNLFINTEAIFRKAFELHLSKEIPEYGLYLHQQRHEELKELLSEMEGLQSVAESALALSGYKELGPDFPDLQIYPELTSLELLGKAEEHREIKSYLGKIKRFATESLFSPEEVKEAAAPTCAEAYLPQAYEKIVYDQEKHAGFFELSKWKKLEKEKGPKVSYALIHSLLNPENSKRPILLLGNPGSGKSMFSRLLSAKLLQQSSFIPFWIPLKKVDSNHIEIKDHISRGVAHLLDVTKEIDWKNWVGAFPERIPVFILDGLDELLKASETDLNGYLLKVKKLQEEILQDGISARFIITSRLTVMDRLNIPEETEIIKLSPFSSAKQKEWCKRWNQIQEQQGKKTFHLPEETEAGKTESQESIAELSQEPLILFLLALYSAGGGDLAHLAKHGGRANLYDELIKQFTARQILKVMDQGEFTIHIQPDTKEYKNRCQAFRLTLGVAAFLMYRLDRTDVKPRELQEGREYFKIPEDQKAEDFFRGFFFLHQNNSQGNEDEQKWNFEFIHKTFGEYLAADFMLSVVQAQGGKEYVSPAFETEKSLRVVMGYQWLTKHPKINSFFLEMASSLSIEEATLKMILKTIKKELKRFQSDEEWPFPVTKFLSGAPYSKIEHFARYSQNLILLWFGLTGAKQLDFNLFEGHEDKLTEKPVIEMSRDIGRKSSIEDNPPPQTRNHQYWQQISQLWKMIGGNANLQALAYRGEAKQIEGKVWFEAYPKKYHGSFVPYKKNMLLDFDLIDHVDFCGKDTFELLKRSPDLAYNILSNLQLGESSYLHQSEFFQNLWKMFPIEQWAGPLSIPFQRLLAKAPSQWAFLQEDPQIPLFFRDNILNNYNYFLFFELLHFDCFAKKDLDLVLDAYRSFLQPKNSYDVSELTELCKLQAVYPTHSAWKEPWFSVSHANPNSQKQISKSMQAAVYLESYQALKLLAGPLLYGIQEGLDKYGHNLTPLEHQQFLNLHEKYQQEIKAYKKNSNDQTFPFD